LGEPLACNSPPIAFCFDADTSTAYDPTGVCGAGTCTYAEISTSCALGCDDDTGLCVDDPCFGVNCDEPPSQCHQELGTCTGGACDYELKAAGTSCDDGETCTSDDACTEAGECEGDVVVCNAPPAPECIGNTSRVYDAAGQCDSSGACVYTQTDTDCQTTCDTNSGLCEGDPCIGVTCNTPPGECFLTNGTCSAGDCSYGNSPAGVVCDDDDACTLDDECDGAGVCGGTADPACGDAGAPDGGMIDDAGAGGMGPGPDAAGPDGGAGAPPTDGGAGDGGGGTTGSGGRPGRDGGEPDPNLNSVEGGGCSCSMPAAPVSPRPFMAAALLCLGLALRRRSRR
jgi:MYXO-CTERM domain-containing protein